MTTKITETEFAANALKLLDESKESAVKLSSDKIVYEEIIKLIDESESLVKEKPSDAFNKFNEARKKIEDAVISNESGALAWKLLKLEIIYLVVLLILAYLTYKWPAFVLWDGLTGNMHLQTAWFGALGGVTIAIYGIFEHIHLRDFDPKYELWYVCKPIIGAIFGWFIYLIYFIGIVSVQGTGNVNIKTPELPFVIAFLAGFSERFTIKMIDKLMSVLTSYEEKPASKDAKK